MLIPAASSGGDPPAQIQPVGHVTVGVPLATDRKSVNETHSVGPAFSPEVLSVRVSLPETARRNAWPCFVSGIDPVESVTRSGPGMAETFPST